VSELKKLANGQNVAEPAALSLKERAESIVAWAAIAYAGGFLTIMLHTARLGIPVVQLIEPINVWVGLPLAVVVMVSKWLLRAVIREHSILKKEFENIRQQFSELKNSPTIAVLDKFTASLLDFFTILPMPILPVSWLLKLLYTAVLRNKLEKLLVEKPETARIPDRLLRWVYRFMALSQGLRALWSYCGFMLSISLIPLGLFIYVWVAYPKIPQEYGGGRPTVVQLAVSSEAIPKDGGDFSKLLAGESRNTEAKALTTIPLKLLFATDNYWYLQLPQGSVMAIRSEDISAVIWREHSK
jgi:hypothetical protein